MKERPKKTLEQAQLDLARLDQCDDQLSSLCIDAYRERDAETVWFCGAGKKEIQRFREKIQEWIKSQPKELDESA